ncbi:polysaccharide pyruvyl transferase family protein [Vibrio coralliirubri]|uniref:polysaccharide pyruvyl transferase family protein n=1 Tax=Vibrio coralliirubri TaxID=1516159 RepID=UPI000A3AF7F5|nr:polysaccharide pyruvyl transferase family protein [Vibrio coralliirubri]
MKILHIAAFEGNIGDNASHMGFINILECVVGEYHIDRLEIRKAYKNYVKEDKLKFDNDFVKLANNYNLVVFGGGGFLDYWVEGSSNGTTIDIEEEFLDKIKTQIIIASVGCNPHKDVPEENYNKFCKFLDFVKTKENIQIALRNDGSVDSIQKDFGNSYLDGLVEILDHGYFYYPKEEYSLPIDDEYVAINITDDQLSMNGGLSTDRDWYYQELEELLAGLVENKLKVVLVPHIHQDIEAIGTALSKISPQLVRNNTVIAPCLQGDKGTDLAFNIYKNSKLVIASRYHANVCAIKFGIPTIGLSPLRRIEYTHKQLLSDDTNIHISPGFAKKILNNLTVLLEKKSDAKLNEMKRHTIDFYQTYFKRITS